MSLSPSWTLPSLGAPAAPISTAAGVAEPVGISPCSLACPLGINVQRYVGLAKEGMLAEALEVIAEACPMPAVCAYMCQRPCESACRRGGVDEPVDIRWLKRAAVEAVLGEGGVRPERRPFQGGLRVAVVGAGPAGLAATRTLGRLGYGVTLVDRHSEPGGLLAQAVPHFRLPKRALRADVEAILAEAPAIELRLGVAVGPSELTIESLLAEGHAAVLLATGAGIGALPLEPPPAIDDVLSPLELLRGILGEGSLSRFSGASVVVAGDSNTAVSAARALARAGCEEVHLLSPRPLERWSVDPEDLAIAESEGVRCRPSTLLLDVEERQGSVEAVTVAPCELDPLGRPSRDEHDEVERLPAGAVLVEGSRVPDLSAVLGLPQILQTEGAAIRTEAVTLRTSMPGVFAAGECATGPKTVVEALAAGKRAARSIDRFVRGRPEESLSSARRRSPELVVVGDGPSAAPPGPAEPVPAGARFTPLAARRAASRCLRCGPCAECDSCEPACPHERYVAVGDVGPIVYRAPAEAAPTAELLAALVDVRRCTGCGLCEATCPHHAVVVRFGPAGEAVARVDRPGCRGCGLCAARCPSGAIDLPEGLHGSARLRGAVAEVIR